MNNLYLGCGSCVRIVEDEIFECKLGNLCSLCKTRIDEREKIIIEVKEMIDKSNFEKSIIAGTLNNETCKSIEIRIKNNIKQDLQGISFARG